MVHAIAVLSSIFHMTFLTVRQNTLVSAIIGFLAAAAWIIGKINIPLALLFVLTWKGCRTPEFLVVLLAIFFWLLLVKDGTRIMDVICIIALASCLVAVAQMLGANWPYAFKKEFSFVGITPNKNFHSALLAMAIPAFFRKWWVYCLVLLVPSLILCESSGGIYALCFSCFVYSLTYKPKYAILFVLAAAAYLYIDNPGVTNRLAEWKRLDMVTIGGGLGSYKKIGHMGSAHNEYIQIIYELGYIAVIPIAFYFYGFLKSFKKISRQTAIGFLTMAGNAFVNPLFHIPQTAIMGLMWMAQYERERHGTA